MKTRHEALLDFYLNVYNQTDNVVFPVCSNTTGLGGNFLCSHQCEPAQHKRAVWLYPYERFVIMRMSGRKLPTGYVPIHAGKACLFFENNQCSLGKSKPIACRMFPVFFYVEVPDHIDVYLYQDICPAISHMPTNILDQHIKFWMGITIALYPYINKRWWEAINDVPRGVLQGRAGVTFDTESNVLQADVTLPVALCATIHDPFCPNHCDRGVMYRYGELVACACVQERLKAMEINLDNP